MELRKTLEGLAWAAVVVLGIVVAIPRVQQRIGVKSAAFMLLVAWVAGSIIALNAIGWPQDWRGLIPVAILGCVLTWVFIAIKPKLHHASASLSGSAIVTASAQVQSGVALPHPLSSPPGSPYDARMEVTVRQKVENGVALLATALSVYFGYWPLALPAAFLFWDAYREHHKLRLAELQKVRRLTEHALVSIALLIVVSLPLAIKELVAPRFAEHHLNPRPEVSAPRTAFLEAMQPEMRPGYSRIAPGELLSATTKWANRTKERVFKAASWVAAYVEHVDGETERRVHRRFAEESALGKSSYYAGKTGGAEVAPDFAIGGIPRTPPLTREQCDSLLRGTARLYLISWAGWTDSFGRRDSASQCEWIETPDTNITDGKWHYCDE